MAAYQNLIKNKKLLLCFFGAIGLVFVGTVLFLSLTKTPNNKETNQKTEDSTSSGAKIESDLLKGQTFECKPTPEGHQYYRTDRTFVIDPTNPNTMYVSIEHVGFLKSIDGGKTWERKTKGIKTYPRKDDPSQPCHGEYPVVTIDPKNTKHLLLGVGGTPTNFDFGYTKAGGLYESFDGGESWKQLVKGWMNIYLTDVVFAPDEEKTIFYGTNAAPSSYSEADPNKIFVTKGLIYKTVNGGENWEELSTGYQYSASATRIYINPDNSKEILVSTFTAPPPISGQGRSTDNIKQMGFLKSFDAGKKWEKIASLPAGADAVLNSAVAAKKYNHVVVSPYGSNQKPLTYYSTDGAKNFKAANMYVDILAFDPHDIEGKHLLGYQRFGNPKAGIFESKDAGASWQRLVDAPKEILENEKLLSEASNIVWDPKDANIVYLTGAGGYIWKSTDGGKNWQVLVSIERLPKEWLAK